jgi:hypothetical protein
MPGHRGVTRVLGHPAGIAVSSALATGAGAQIAASSDDNKLVLVDGVTTGVAFAPEDTATILDLSVVPPRVLAEIPAPGSKVSGGPTAVRTAAKPR